MRGKPVKVVDDELIVDDDADDMFSVFAKGCEGEIRINTPFGNHRFKRDKIDKKIKKIK